VYLIAGKSIGVVSLDKATTVASLTEKEKDIYEKFIVENDDKYVLVDEVNGGTSYNSQAIAKLIKDYTVFANTDVYGTNVVGAIGGPTLELLAAGWNAKKYTPTMTLTKNVYGYKITNGYFVDAASDGLYIAPNYYYWLASPSAYANNYVMCAGFGGVGGGGNSSACDIRPVVCLKASIPATVSTGDYSFSLIK
jgi:hypothetical protein